MIHMMICIYHCAERKDYKEYLVQISVTSAGPFQRPQFRYAIVSTYCSDETQHRDTNFMIANELISIADII